MVNMLHTGWSTSGDHAVTSPAGVAVDAGLELEKTMLQTDNARAIMTSCP